jgi:hypothetical protein
MDSRILPLFLALLFLALTACTHARDIPITPVALADGKIADKAKIMPPPPPPETKAIAPVMTDIEVDEGSTSSSEIQ